MHEEPLGSASIRNGEPLRKLEVEPIQMLSPTSPREEEPRSAEESSYSGNSGYTDERLALEELEA